ncbi:hypothetical protein [Candidatus Uabimicrobium sp. HlEnr_7]|uniref:hypothetical protein n=1 Tax=Candidatus Uabimicrobium helgolandensis TaxID=3095367 RepID=UPI003556572E
MYCKNHIYLLLIIGSLIVCSFADNARLDDHFAENGILVLDTKEGDDSVSSVATKHDTIVYAGRTNSVAVSKVFVAVSNQDGILDTTFGTDGRVVIDIGAPSIDSIAVNGVAIDNNQNIVVVGTLQLNSRSAIFAVRLLPSGILDTSFSNNGIILLAKLEGEEFNMHHGNDVIIADINKTSLGQEIIIARTSYSGARTIAGVAVLSQEGYLLQDLSTFTENTECLSIAIDKKKNIFGVGSRASGSFIFKMDRHGVLDGRFNGDGTIDIANVRLLSITTESDKVLVCGLDVATSSAIVQRFSGVHGTRDPHFNNDKPLIFTSKKGNYQQTGSHVFTRGTEIVVIGSFANKGDVAGFIVILDYFGNIRTTFNTKRLIDSGKNTINESLTTGIVDTATNCIIAAGIGLNNKRFSGVAIRIIEE